MSARVAALYVDPAGVYAGLDDVDLWDEKRDARLYAGPWSVVAHPPCKSWSIMGQCRPEKPKWLALFTSWRDARAVTKVGRGAD
jgi:hypothetical protein